MSHDPAPLSSGTPVRAVDFPPAKFAFQQVTIANVSSTTYIAGTPEVAVRVLAPTSGKVAVIVGGGLDNNAANADRIFLSFRVYEGDPALGVLIRTEDVKYGLSNQATQTDQFQYSGHGTIMSGLTPGTYYYFQLRHRVSIGSGTADIAYRHLLVFPVP